MNFKAFLLFSTFACQVDSQWTKKNPDTIFKLLRASCNSSGITIANMKCRVRSLSRNSQNYAFSYEIVKDIDEIFVSFFVS
jgi:hypothetical protein